MCIGAGFSEGRLPCLPLRSSSPPFPGGSLMSFVHPAPSFIPPGSTAQHLLLEARLPVQLGFSQAPTFRPSLKTSDAASSLVSGLVIIEVIYERLLPRGACGSLQRLGRPRPWRPLSSNQVSTEKSTVWERSLSHPRAHAP